MFSSFMTLFALLLLATSCDEQEEVSEYDNWQARNVAYVDSIANLANAGTDGWVKYQSYTLGDNLGMDADNSFYIYVKKLEVGTGEASPSDGDRVRGHFCGSLITGEVFDKSYSGSELNEKTDVPALMKTISTVAGFATALERMVEGDRWKVVIPSYIGYWTNSNASIPAYSTLIFDLKLARLYKDGENTNWH